MKIKTITDQIEKFAPSKNSMPNDPIGLQIGDLNQDVNQVLVTLDVRPEVVQEAIDHDIHFIFSHHPAVFHSMRQIDLTNAQQKMYGDLIKHDITVFSAHTNVDQAVISMNDWLAQKLDLTDIKPFTKAENTHGELVDLGRKGNVKKTITLNEFVDEVKTKFQLDGVRVIANDLNQLVQSVAIIGGDGGKFFMDAKRQQIDVFITGDVYYHTAHDMLAENINVIDVGHHVESIFKSAMAAQLKSWAQEFGWDLTVVTSQISTDPFTFK